MLDLNKIKSENQRSTASLKATATIDRWTVLETLGRGFSSKVKLVQDGLTGELAAIKLVKTTAPKEKLESVRKEAKILAEVSGKHIIKQEDYYDTVVYKKAGGKSYEVLAIVLEYASEGDLFEFIVQAGGFREPLARNLMLQVLEAVKICHSKAIAHRDIKPQNLLVNENYDLKLADFGFAVSNVMSKEIARNEFFVGTENFAAPEIYLESTSYDPKAADIFALGVTLFVMRVGTLPFQKAKSSDSYYSLLLKGENIQFWRLHSMRRDAKAKSIISSDFKDLVTKMISPDPAERPTIDGVLQHDWFKGDVASHEDLVQNLKQLKTRVDMQRQGKRCNTTIF